MEQATTVQKLLSVDTDKKENQKTAHRINLGFLADDEVKKLVSAKKVSERAVLEFRSECKLLLVTLVGKLMIKSPLSKSLVRSLACLAPEEMIMHSDRCKEKFKNILKLLVSCNRINIKDCDDIQCQYEHFVQEAKHSEEMRFSPDHDRLDKFYFDKMKDNEKYCKVWKVVSILLLLSHGQATVERGFSINKEVSEVNLSENNLIAQRVIKDYITCIGGLQGVVITKELLQSAQHARQTYHTYLDRKRVEQNEKVKSGKRKIVEDEVETLKKKKTAD